MWHSVNAFEQGGELLADFVGYSNPDHLVGVGAAVHAVMAGGQGVFRTPGQLWRYRVDPARKKVARELLTEVYDSRSRKSHLAVLESGRLADGPMARVMLRHHVPFSYHGWWLKS